MLGKCLYHVSSHTCRRPLKSILPCFSKELRYFVERSRPMQEDSLQWIAFVEFSTTNGTVHSDRCFLVYGSLQPRTQACSRYPSDQRRLGTEANFPDKLDRWRHIRNRRGRLGTRLGILSIIHATNKQNCWRGALILYLVSENELLKPNKFRCLEIPGLSPYNYSKKGIWLAQQTPSFSKTGVRFFLKT